MVKFDNTDVIYREYPFLEKIAPRRKIRAARAARFEQDMFYWSSEGIGEVPGDLKRYDFHLLDVEGNLLKTVGKWWFIRLNKTIAGTIRALGKRGKRVKYIAHVDGNFVTLYKMPNQYNDATEWLEEILTKEIADWQQ